MVLLRLSITAAGFDVLLWGRIVRAAVQVNSYKQRYCERKLPARSERTG